MKHCSFDQVDVSNRFMTICEHLGIPISKSRTGVTQNEQPKNRRKNRKLTIRSINNRIQRLARRILRLAQLLRTRACSSRWRRLSRSPKLRRLSTTAFSAAKKSSHRLQRRPQLRMVRKLALRRARLRPLQPKRTHLEARRNPRRSSRVCLSAGAPSPTMMCPRRSPGRPPRRSCP